MQAIDDCDATFVLATKSQPPEEALSQLTVSQAATQRRRPQRWGAYAAFLKAGLKVSRESVSGNHSCAYAPTLHRLTQRPCPAPHSGGHCRPGYHG